MLICIALQVFRRGDATPKLGDPLFPVCSRLCVGCRVRLHQGRVCQVRAMWRLEVVEATHHTHTHTGHAKKALIPDYAQKPMYTLYEDCWGEVPLERVVQLGGQPTIIQNQ